MKAHGYNWTAIHGDFDIQPNSIIFNGEPTPYDDPSGKKEIGDKFGLLLSDQEFREGEITAEVQFEKIDSRTNFQIVFYYNSINGDNISAGICGGNAMFSVQSTMGGKVSMPIFNGDHKNLKAKQTYQLTVKIKGTQVFLLVDHVEVLSYLLPYNFQQGVVGVLLLSQSKITIKSYSIRPHKPQIFMVMKLDEKYNAIYEDAIKEVCKDFDIVKADEIYGPGIIISDIFDKINNAKLVIAEVTPENANVFYEVGYAQALKKPTILIAEKDRILPFDIKAFRVVFYENTIVGKKKLQESLKKHIDSILNEQIKI